MILYSRRIQQASKARSTLAGRHHVGVDLNGLVVQTQVKELGRLPVVNFAAGGVVVVWVM